MLAGTNQPHYVMTSDMARHKHMKNISCLFFVATCTTTPRHHDSSARH